MPYNNIPQYLKDHAFFCLWRYETDKNGRLTKVPYNPLTLKRAKTNNISTFTTYDNAIDKISDFDGIGIKVTDDIVAIDLDHCLEEGKLNHQAKQIISKFSTSYIEISPSGSGLRIILLNSDNLDFNPKQYHYKKANVEFYTSSTNRFVTLTGNIYQKGDIVENNDGIEWLLENHLKRKTPINKSFDVLEKKLALLSDDEVVEKASNAKNGLKFQSLWVGNILDYPSHSEADSALCSILAFYCNGNLEQIDRLFRKSGLYRKKWDSLRGNETYGRMTILKALSTSKEFYKPIVVSNAQEDFSDELILLQDYQPEEQKAYAYNELGAAKLYADVFKSYLRYVPERKSWFYYANGIWQKDIGEIIAKKKAMSLANALYMYAININDSEHRQRYIAYVIKWQKHTFRNNLLKDAQVHYPISNNKFDQDPFTFNCKNGTLNLKTLDFRDHKADDLLTKISPVVYNPQAKDERWQLFIEEIMSGDKDKSKFLQKMMGYGLSGDTKYECFFILYGQLTRNGKGTLCESVLSVMGTYGATAKAETIALKGNSGGSAPSEDVARLSGVRFVNISEPNKGLVLDTAKVKTMTGNDTLNARFLHENSFDFKPQFKLYVNTNYLPQITDMSIFTSGRLLIIPFNKHFKPTEQDRNLKRYFSKTESQSAILNWLVEGYQLLQKEGLIIPDCVNTAIQQHKDESDKFKQFVNDCMIKDINSEERTANIYARYKAWCVDNGYHYENKKNFNTSLATIGVVKRKRPQGCEFVSTLLLGYKLVSEFLE